MHSSSFIHSFKYLEGTYISSTRIGTAKFWILQKESGNIQVSFPRAKMLQWRKSNRYL